MITTESKRKRMPKQYRRIRIGRLILVILLPVLFMLSLAYACNSIMDRPVIDLPILPESIDDTLADYTEYVKEMAAINKDAVGWLKIPDTTIDSVVLHDADGQNSEYYLFRNINLDPTDEGSLCADYRAEFGKGSRRELSPLTALYGHSFSEDPAGGGPFSPLKLFRDENFAREHPYLYFSTAHENMAFEIVAVFEAHIDLPYIVPDLSEDRRRRMLDAVRDSSLYSYDTDFTDKDRLLVLSTCAMTVQGHDNLDPYDTDYRFCIMAKLVPAGEAVKEQASLAVNPSPAAADTYIGF